MEKNYLNKTQEPSSDRSDMVKEKIFVLFIERLGFREFSSLSHLRKQIPWIKINSTIVFWFYSNPRLGKITLHLLNPYTFASILLFLLSNLED